MRSETPSRKWDRRLEAAMDAIGAWRGAATWQAQTQMRYRLYRAGATPAVAAIALDEGYRLRSQLNTYMEVAAS